MYWNHIESKGLLSGGKIRVCRMQFRPAAYSRQSIGCMPQCPNGGSCLPDGEGYQCICAVGYTGWRCEDSALYDGPTDTFIIIFFLALIVEALATYGMCVCWLQRRRRAEMAEEETHQLLIMTKQCESWDQFVMARGKRMSSRRRATRASRGAQSWHSLRSWQLALDNSAPLRRCSAYRTMDSSAPSFQRSLSLSEAEPPLTRWQALIKALTSRRHKRRRRRSR